MKTTIDNDLMQGRLDEEAAAIAAVLDAHPNYRVLRMVRPPEALTSSAPPIPPIRTAAVLDVETTGLSADFDTIIELAIKRIEFDAAGRIVRAGKPWSWLQDPLEPLDPEIIAITGLTDAQLKGQSIDKATATAILTSVDVIIAHNAKFDRPFVDGLLPAVRGAAWTCSMAEVDWRARHMEGKALGYLLAQAGLFHGAHRAASDVMALINLLVQTDDTGETVLAELIRHADTPSLKVMAVGSPFDRKEHLKRRGYSWNADDKYWWTEIAAADEARERAFLAEYAYTDGGEPLVELVTSRDRYRDPSMTR